MDHDISTNEELREHILAWLRSNDIDPTNVPHDAYVSLVDDQLTTDVFVQNEQGKRQWLPNGDVAKTTATFTVTAPPPADVAEWLRPRCATCGR